VTGKITKTREKSKYSERNEEALSQQQKVEKE
jgi:hypothetical protein